MQNLTYFYEYLTGILVSRGCFFDSSGLQEARREKCLFRYRSIVWVGEVRALGHGILSLVSRASLLFFVGSGLGGCNLGSLAGLLDDSKDLRLREAYAARTNRAID